MRTTVIDCSRSPGPGYPAPEPVRKGKFVQIWQGDAAEYFVCAPRALATYHANLVQRFLDERGVAGRYNEKRDTFWHDDERWVVLGGGHFTLDTQARTLWLSGASMAYGTFEPAGLAERLAASVVLAGYEITVE